MRKLNETEKAKALLGTALTIKFLKATSQGTVVKVTTTLASNDIAHLGYAIGVLMQTAFELASPGAPKVTRLNNLEVPEHEGEESESTNQTNA